MSLQDRLMKLSQYNVDFRFYDEWVLVGIQYVKGWQVLEPSNQLIEHLSKNGKYYYCAPLKEVSVDEVFDCIEETIEYNKDLEKKLQLFQEKIDELQRIFASEDYETLLSLTFKLKKNRRKKVKTEVEQTETPDTEKEEPIDDGVRFVDTTAEEEVEETPQNNYLEPLD